MADKVCRPGPICGSSNNCTDGGIHEAVCVHTNKVYDSCKSKECLRDIRVYLCRDAQELLNSGSVVAVKPRSAELLCVKIDVEKVQFNRGFYTVDIRFFYKIECEVNCLVGRPRIIEGLSVFDKRVVLCGGEGGARIFSSRYVEDGMDVQLCPNSNKPTAVVEVVDPILLDARIVAPEATCNCCCCPLNEIPCKIGSCFHGDDLALGMDGYQLFITLGQFSIIRLERDIQLLMPAYDICMPHHDCSNSGAADTQDPCSVFANFEFPIDEFFPSSHDCTDYMGGKCGCDTNYGSCGCGSNASAGGCGCGSNNTMKCKK